MKLFSSWSGGKDCMLALYRVLKTKKHELSFLVNMCDANGELSRSHGLKKQVIIKQADSLDIVLIQKQTDFNAYEENFKSVIADLKERGISGGIFGDIYLKEHRIWIERICKNMEIEAIFPLWNENTMDLLREFIVTGFKARTVSVNKNMLAKSWLNQEIDLDFAYKISKLEGIDPCAENGEYHSFVYGGPIFKYPLKIVSGKVFEDDNHWFQEINLAE